MVMPVPTRSGRTLKLVMSYSALEDNFVLTVDGLPAHLMPRTADQSSSLVTSKAVQLDALSFALNGVQIVTPSMSHGWYFLEHFARDVSAKTED